MDEEPLPEPPGLCDEPSPEPPGLCDEPPLEPPLLEDEPPLLEDEPLPEPPPLEPLDEPLPGFPATAELSLLESRWAVVLLSELALPPPCRVPAVWLPPLSCEGRQRLGLRFGGFCLCGAGLGLCPEGLGVGPVLVVVVVVGVVVVVVGKVAVVGVLPEVDVVVGVVLPEVGVVFVAATPRPAPRSRMHAVSASVRAAERKRCLTRRCIASVHAQRAIRLAREKLANELVV